MAAAYILIELNTAVDFPETLGAIRALPGVKSAHLVVGPTDCIVYIEADDHQQMIELIRTIRAVKGVERTDTRTVAEL
jgi:DNA-binding Lrp family transcriptional regulator